MEIHAVNILYDFCIMSTLLLIAKIIRSKVKIIQKLYIPSSLLGGMIGLLLGKYFLNILPFSTEISNYSSILITILFATMFLGSKRKVSFKTMISNVGDSFLINGAAEIAQFGLFIIIGVLILPMFFKSINIGFGLLLPAGFVGGHGTAAAIGAAFADMGWDEATSIGQTFATIGLISGIVLGVIIINIGTRKGYTRLIKKIDELPEDMRTGLISKESRSSMGENTVSPCQLTH
ncbi:sodium/glutamate symporter [Agathobaculum hominis]